MRQKEKHIGRAVTIWIDPGLLSRVDRMAEKSKVSRSRLMSNMIEVTTESLERADAFGILSIAILLRNFEESLKTFVKDVGGKSGVELPA